MATITATDMTGSGERTATITTLGASDTFTYTKNKNQVLILNNVTAGALTPNFDGDGATTYPVTGVGDVDLTAGYTTGSIGAGAQVAIPLNTIGEYLAGTIALTGADAIEATLLEF